MFRKILLAVGIAAGTTIAAAHANAAVLRAQLAEKRRKYVEVTRSTFLGDRDLRISHNEILRDNACDQTPECKRIYDSINACAKKYGCDKVDLDDEKKALSLVLLDDKSMSHERIQRFACTCNLSPINPSLRMFESDDGREWQMHMWREDGESSANYTVFVKMMPAYN